MKKFVQHKHTQSRFASVELMVSWDRCAKFNTPDGFLVSVVLEATYVSRLSAQKNPFRSPRLETRKLLGGKEEINILPDEGGTAETKSKLKK